MKVSEAIENLGTIDPDETIAMMVVREEEIKEVCGPRYPHVERVCGIISRKIRGYNTGIEKNYWYENRLIFRKLVEDATDYIEKDIADERVRKSNDRLGEEMGLKNITLSLKEEIRPLAIFNKKEVGINIVGGINIPYTLPANSTYAEFLNIVDGLNVDAGDHTFLEGWGFNEKTELLEIYFGS